MANKRGQLTIFIILSILIVIGIFIFLSFFRSDVSLRKSSFEDPQGFIQGCAEDAIGDSLKVILENGGRIKPSQYLLYRDEVYNYLCYQGDYYLSCYNTHPSLEKIVENELMEDTVDEIEACFALMEEEFEDRGYSVEMGSLNYSVDLVPGRIDLNVNRKFSVRDDEGSTEFEAFDAEFISALYELVDVTREIVNSEAQYCNMEYNGYMILHPEFDIKRFDYDGSKIYIVGNRDSLEEFKFAVRSCAFAPGI